LKLPEPPGRQQEKDKDNQGGDLNHPRLFGRAGRFFLVAATLWLFGARIRTTLERNFDLAALAFFVLLVGGFAALKLL